MFNYVQDYQPLLCYDEFMDKCCAGTAFPNMVYPRAKLSILWRSKEIKICLELYTEVNSHRICLWEGWPEVLLLSMLEQIFPIRRRRSTARCWTHCWNPMRLRPIKERFFAESRRSWRRKKRSYGFQCRNCVHLQSPQDSWKRSKRVFDRW